MDTTIRITRDILVALLLAVLCFAASGSAVFADCMESDEGVPASEANCMSDPTDHIITPDMIPGGGSDSKDPGTMSAQTINTDKNIPIVVIVIGFNNMPYSNNYDWGDILFDPSDGRSLLQYYKDMSYGKFTFAPVRESSKYGTGGNTNYYDKANDGIIHVNVDFDHKQWKSWGADNAENGKVMIKAFIDAANKAMPYVENLSALDKDESKWLSSEELAMVFIVAGYDSGVIEERRKHDEGLYMRSHKSSFGGMQSKVSIPKTEWRFPRYDGIEINPYVAISEQCEVDFTGGTVNGRMSSLAHELGHHLGLPDLYDKSNEDDQPWRSYAVGDLSLMAHGSWAKNAEGKYAPTSFDPWCRMQLGWNIPMRIEDPGPYRVNAQDFNDLTTKNTVLKLPPASVHSGGEEYYMIEVRRTNKWDEGLSYLNQNSWATKDQKGGIVIWHVDDQVLNNCCSGSTWNGVNNTDHRPGLMPLYLENDFQTWISNGDLVNRSTPFFDSYNWNNNYGSASGLEEDIVLPSYNGLDITSGPETRVESGARIQILDDAADSMVFSFWDSSHEHNFGYSYHVYPEDYCENGGTWQIYEDCKTCWKKKLCSEYYEAEGPGHMWREDYVTEEPGYGYPGTAFFTCNVCGATKFDSIPALPLSGKMGKDGTPLGEGASKQAADKALKAFAKEKDPAGSKFSKLKLKSTKQGKSYIKLTWKSAGAVRYVIYGSKCGKDKKLRRLKTTTSKGATIKKVAGSKVKSKTYYKFIVVALDADDNVVSTSKMIHVATKGSKAKSNHTSVYVKKSILSKAKKLKKNSTLSLKAVAKKGKGCKVAGHVGLRYQSSNKKVVKVSSKGILKGVGKGSAKVWVYAQNGIYKTVYVTVK